MLFLIYINNLPDDVISNIPIYANDTTLYSKCDLAYDLREQLELASELEFYLIKKVDLSSKWLVNSMLEKLNWFHLTGLKHWCY